MRLVTAVEAMLYMVVRDSAMLVLLGSIAWRRDRSVGQLSQFVMLAESHHIMHHYTIITTNVHLAADAFQHTCSSSLPHQRSLCCHDHALSCLVPLRCGFPEMLAVALHLVLSSVYISGDLTSRGFLKVSMIESLFCSQSSHWIVDQQ